MAELRRTAVGNISEKDLCTLPQLVDALHLYQKGENSSQMKSLIKPAEEILSLASLRLSNESEDTVCRGAPLAMSGVASVEASFAKGEYVELLSQKGKLLCIANAVVDSEELSSSIDKSKIVAYPKIVLEKRLGKKEKEKNKQKEKTKL
jgi:H/ACA ribonucleoprotein complex subunit 4